MAKTVLKSALIVIGILAILITVVLAVPVKLWSTGEAPPPELEHRPPVLDTVKPERLWVDTDAACGTGPRRDPDDCLALLLRAVAAHVDDAGNYTVFGNAPVAEADPATRALVQTRAGGCPAISGESGWMRCLRFCNGLRWS